MTDWTDPATDGRPTTASTALVALVALVTAAVLVDQAAVVGPAVVGTVGAITLAIAVWAAGWERHRSLGIFCVSLLTFPVGVGIVAATVGTVIVLSGSLFPVPSLEQLPETVIGLVARAMVVLGAVVTVFGVATAVRGVLDRRTAERATTASLKTTIPPFTAGLLMATGTVLEHLESTTTTPGPGALVGEALRFLTATLFRPDPTRPHVATALLLVGGALFVGARALRALPLTELLPERPDETDPAATVERVQQATARAARVVVLLVPVGALVDFAVPPAVLRSSLPPAVYELLVSLTTAPAIRTLAWWTIAVSAAVVAVVWALRRVARAATDRIAGAVLPFVAGGLVAIAVLLVADPVLRATVDWVADTLPGRFGEQFAEFVAPVVDFYGAATLVMIAVSLVLLLAAVAALSLWLVTRTKFLEGRTAGVSLASMALFNAAAFAGVLDVPAAVVLGALVAAVFVWDVGEFAITLGEEIGRVPETRGTELVHATGTLAVGGFGAGAALLVSDRTVGVVSVASEPVLLGLVAVLVGLVSLVLALR